MQNRLFYISFAFGVSFAVMILISFGLFKKIISIEDKIQLVEHTHEVRNQILKLQSTIVEAERTQKSFLLAKDTDLLPLSETQKNILKEINKLQQLTADNPEQQQILKKLKEAISRWYQVLYTSINHTQDDKADSYATTRDKGNKLLRQVTNLSRQMDQVELTLLKQRRDQLSVVQFAAPRYLGLILFASCVFQLVSFLVIISAFKKRRVYQLVLEKKIKELNATNSELEQIAFIASHDLQEPLRKIRTFSDKLSINYQSMLDVEGKLVVEKIAVASRRVQELLNDLITYTNLTKNEEELARVDLNQCLKETCSDSDDLIKQKKAVIKSCPLPVVEGYHKQLNLLFYNLLHNALKFSKPGVEPVINVSAASAKGIEVASSDMFTKISFQDNGMGFENEFNKKIFVLFNRLNSTSSPIPGKGIGLAICKKVMVNHNGFIAAKGELGVGATFNLYFPSDLPE